MLGQLVAKWATFPENTAACLILKQYCGSVSQEERDEDTDTVMWKWFFSDNNYFSNPRILSILNRYKMQGMT